MLEDVYHLPHFVNSLRQSNSFHYDLFGSKNSTSEAHQQRSDMFKLMTFMSPQVTWALIVKLGLEVFEIFVSTGMTEKTIKFWVPQKKSTDHE